MSKKVNWHLAACNAIEIDLRDYASILEYEREHPLGKNYFRIDLLVIKKALAIPIQKRIASHFKKINIFEIKGIHDSASIRSFFKTHGYTGLYIDSQWEQEQLGREDITLNFLSLRYPRKLISYLENNHKFPIAKTAPGIYDMDRGLFQTRFIVTQELLPEDGLYLRCLTDQLAADRFQETAKQMFIDVRQHKSEPLYAEYLDQIIRANASRKGDMSMSRFDEIMLEHFGFNEITIREEKRKNEAIIKHLQDENAQLKQRLAECGIQVPAEITA